MNIVPDSATWCWLLGFFSGLFWGLVAGRRWARRDFDQAFDEGAVAALDRFPAYLEAWHEFEARAEQAASCAIEKGQERTAAIEDAVNRLGPPALPRLDDLRRRR